MEELTKTEERVMQIFWQLKRAFVKDIIEQLPENPKPPYNTISSVVRILEKKGYLGYKAYGKTYEYFPLVSKGEYRATSFKRLLRQYFDNSPTSLLSFIVKEEKLSSDQVQQLLQTLSSPDEEAKPSPEEDAKTQDHGQ